MGQHKDTITIRDERGNERELTVEALFDMEERTFALLSSDEGTVLMRVEGEGDHQELVSITDPEEYDAILDVYEIAMEATEEDK